MSKSEEARRYYLDNHEVRLDAQRRYYLENRDLVRERSRLRYYAKPMEACATAMGTAAKNRAKKSGVECHIKTPEILARFTVAPFCDCCWKDFDFTRGRGHKGNDRSPTLDQIVPQGGYVEGNIAYLCYRCNRLKADASSEELTAVARWMKEVGL